MERTTKDVKAKAANPGPRRPDSSQRRSGGKPEKEKFVSGGGEKGGGAANRDRDFPLIGII